MKNFLKLMLFVLAFASFSCVMTTNEGETEMSSLWEDSKPISVRDSIELENNLDKLSKYKSKLDEKMKSAHPINGELRFLGAKRELIIAYESTFNKKVKSMHHSIKNQLSRDLSKLFKENVVENYTLDNVKDFYSGAGGMDIVQVSLMENLNFGIPASVKLAQAALETGYGKKVIGNAYFGVKYNNNKYSRGIPVKSQKIATTEYKNGKRKYEVGNFNRYNTAWESFRDHSHYIVDRGLYDHLIDKDFNKWVDPENGLQVHYATSPIYGKTLKSIIIGYNLALLDI